MTQPPYGQSPQDPSEQNPGYQQQSPQQGYGQQPGGYQPAPGAPAGHGGPVQGRPWQVTTAAVLAFIAGAFNLLGALGLLLVGDEIEDLGISSGLAILFGLLYVAFAVGYIFGGIQAITGKNQKILVMTAGAAIVLQVISWIIIEFSGVSLIGLILPVLIIVLLISAQSKQWFGAKGGATF